MTHDELVVLSLLASFATLLTSHLALVFGLAGRSLWWRAVVALPFVPLAPYWGARAGMHVRTVVWVLSALAYLAIRFAAR
jgi:hypothetical protein